MPFFTVGAPEEFMVSAFQSELPESFDGIGVAVDAVLVIPSGIAVEIAEDDRECRQRSSLNCVEQTMNLSHIFLSGATAFARPHRK